MNRPFLPSVTIALWVVTSAVSTTNQEPVPDPRPVLLAAGDIARCGSQLGGAVATARLLDNLAGTILTLGDHAYADGSEKNFRDCYEPTWGRHRARTRPTPGNHDYSTRSGAPYFAYFGEQAGPERRGYYSFDVGAWHVISLNSSIDAGPRSAQLAWLRDDLQQHRVACTLAYYHVPLFSSGDHGNNPKMEDAWTVLYEHGVDIVLNGHDHNYERFAPQDAKGTLDRARGIRQFVVGTGGGGVYKFERLRSNSEARNNTSYGVLKLTLSPTAYDWAFVPAVGAFEDAGRADCVGLPAAADQR